MKPDHRFFVAVNDKPLRGHATRTIGVYFSGGVYLLSLDCDNELYNGTAEVDSHAAIEAWLKFPEG
jgi:hypothetical protein